MMHIGEQMKYADKMAKKESQIEKSKLAKWQDWGYQNQLFRIINSYSQSLTNTLQL